MPTQGNPQEPGKFPSWFLAYDNYEEAKEKAVALFKEVRGALPDVPEGKRVPKGAKFTDDRFQVDPRDHPPCWFIGGEADEAEDLLQVPESWERISDLIAKPSLFSPKKYTIVHQGHRDDGYLVEAMQAIGLREHLVRKIMPEEAQCPERGLYVVLLFKNAWWVPTIVDDYMPFHQSEPMCTTSSQFPSVSWPSVLQKAYARFHRSYESIGGGGSVLEALVDLTGGVGAKFGVRDISADRLFVYLHELQSDTIFVATVDATECAKRGVRFAARKPYVVHRCVAHEGRCYVQLCCPGVSSGPFDDVIPYSLLHNHKYPEKEYDGFMWVSVEDFQNYFAFITECRLVQDGPWGSRTKNVAVAGAPVPRPLAHVEKTLFMWCTPDPVPSEKTPEFQVNVFEGVNQGAGCEIFFMVSQPCLRYENEERGEYTTTRLNVQVYELVDGGGYAMVAESGESCTRDAFLCFKAIKPANFLVRVKIPEMDTPCAKMIVRCYVTAANENDVEVPMPEARGRKHTFKPPEKALSGTPMSFCGRFPASAVFNEEEGRGAPRGERPEEDDGGGCVVS